MENEKKFEGEKRRLTCEYEHLAMQRRVEDAVENVVRLESLGLSRRIAMIVSARAFGLSTEKLTEILNGK